MAASRRAFGIVNNGFFVQGWDIHNEKLLVGGMWWDISFMQEHYIMNVLIKQDKYMIKLEDIVSSFPL